MRHSTHSRAVTVAAVVASVVTPGCRNPFADAPPLEEGATMTYTITEALQEHQESWVLRARFREAADGMEVRMETPHGTSAIPVSDTMLPLDEKLAPMAFPLAMTSSTAKPGFLWLPADYRKEGLEWKDGARTRGILRRNQWKTWEVVGADGMPRYYEVGTGLLVDFKLIAGPVRVSGTLVSAQ